MGDEIGLLFDGVVNRSEEGGEGQAIATSPVKGVKEFIHMILKEGFQPVIFSNRYKKPAGIEAVQEWLKKHDFPEGIRVQRDKPTDALMVLDPKSWPSWDGKFPTSGDISKFKLLKGKASETFVFSPERIREKRKELNLTQEEIAEKLNMSKSNFSRIEQGKRTPNVDQLANLAALFDVDPNFFYDTKKGRK